MRQKGAGAQLIAGSASGKRSRIQAFRSKNVGHAVLDRKRFSSGNSRRAWRLWHCDAIRYSSIWTLGSFRLLWERFDIAVRQAEYFKNPFQHLVLFLRSENFAAGAQELGGYDLRTRNNPRRALAELADSLIFAPRSFSVAGIY